MLHENEQKDQFGIEAFIASNFFGLLRIGYFVPVYTIFDRHNRRFWPLKTVKVPIDHSLFRI
jgi:hypothetical protein